MSDARINNVFARKRLKIAKNVDIKAARKFNRKYNPKLNGILTLTLRLVLHLIRWQELRMDSSKAHILQAGWSGDIEKELDTDAILEIDKEIREGLLDAFKQRQQERANG